MTDDSITTAPAARPATAPAPATPATAELEARDFHQRTLAKIRNERLEKLQLALGFCDLHKSDSQAEFIARKTARADGEPKPQGALERFAASWLFARGHFWEETKVGQRRLQFAMAEKALEGAQAYLNGDEGNQYADFLEKRYGPFSTYHAPFRFRHWWFAKEWNHPGLWVLAIIMGLIGIGGLYDDDVNRILEGFGMRDFFKKTDAGSWGRTIAFLLAPISVLVARVFLTELFGTRLFRGTREKEKSRHNEDWQRASVFRIQAETRQLPMPSAEAIQVTTWYGGAGDRFARKEFWSEIISEHSSIDVLSHVASALSQSHLCQPWRVTPHLRQGLMAKEISTKPAWDFGFGRGISQQVYATEETRVGFVAVGQYTWDDQSFLARCDDGLVVTTDISRMRGGNGTIHLECMAFTNVREDRSYLRLRFMERAHPMWLRRQADALVAMTILEVAQRLACDVAPANWRFLEGDWTVYQLLRIPGYGQLELQPSCSLVPVNDHSE